MKNLKPVLRIALCGVLMLSLNACALFKKKDKYAGMSDSDMVNGAPLPERQEGVSFTGSNVDRNKFAPIHFAYDSVSVDPGEKGNLDTVAKFMKSSDKQLIIAGFTDERGTAEYNRGLGERRAQAVRTYLLQKGADTERIQTTSFGSEMPADTGHNESAWAKNRRAEFGVTK